MKNLPPFLSMATREEMPEKTSGYTTDNAGNPSTIRLVVMIAVVGGVGLAFLATWMSSVIGMSGAVAIVGMAVTGKVWQKGIECSECGECEECTKEM